MLEAGQSGAAARVRRWRLPELGSLSRPFGLPPVTALGRALILLLFVLIPLFNPALVKVGDERLYVGTILVLLAAVLMLPALLSRRFDWILGGLAFGGLYVFEAGLLRGDLSLGIVGNVYRPLHAVLAFCAFAVFLVGADSERWTRLFLLGGLVGCMLAVVNTLVPGIDPFALSRPDIGYESRFLSSERQSGAFVYPGNFGPYAAYVALVALVMIERKDLRPFSFNLYSGAFLFGLLGMLTSGSRGAAMGFLLGSLVVLWRSPRFRLPFAVMIAVVAVLGSAALLIAGTFREILESRLLLADFSFEERLRSWDIAWDGLRHSILFGGGVVPNTIDSTVIYYLGVGGVVGLLLVAAMYWTTLLRPTRFGDWANLPLLVAVGGVSLTQEALGTPLSSWSIAAAIFLTTTPARRQEIFASARSRYSILGSRRAIAVGAGVVALIAAGSVIAGRIPVSGDAPPGPVLVASEVMQLPVGFGSGLDPDAATDPALAAEEEPFWLLEGTPNAVEAHRLALGAASPDGEEEARLDATEELPTLTASRARGEVARWTSSADPEPALVEAGPRRISIATMPPGAFEPSLRGTARLDPPAPGEERSAQLAVWDGNTADLVVVDRGVGRIEIEIRSGESRFRKTILSASAPRFPAEDSSFEVDVGRISGSKPDLVLTTLNGPTDDPEVHVLSGESGFREFILQVRLDLPETPEPEYAFAPSRRRGDPVLLAISYGGQAAPKVAVLPLLYLPEDD